MDSPPSSRPVRTKFCTVSRSRLSVPAEVRDEHATSGCQQWLALLPLLHSFGMAGMPPHGLNEYLTAA
jgi:hypothetical protein